MDADSILAGNRRDTHASSLTLDLELKVYAEGQGLRATLGLHQRYRYAESAAGELELDCMFRLDTGGPNRNAFLYQQRFSPAWGERIDAWWYSDATRKAARWPFDRFAYLPGCTLRHGDFIVARPAPGAASLAAAAPQPVPGEVGTQAWAVDFPLASGTTPGPPTSRIWVDASLAPAVEHRIEEAAGPTPQRTIALTGWTQLDSSTWVAGTRTYEVPQHVEILGLTVTTVAKIVAGSIRQRALGRVDFSPSVLESTTW